MSKLKYPVPNHTLQGASSGRKFVYRTETGRDDKEEKAAALWEAITDIIRLRNDHEYSNTSVVNNHQLESVDI